MAFKRGIHRIATAIRGLTLASAAFWALFIHSEPEAQWQAWLAALIPLALGFGLAWIVDGLAEKEG
jgi:hypothetical protein